LELDIQILGRIIGVDYGKVRTGISVTDPLQIIVTGLNTIETKNFHEFIRNYVAQESVDKIVFGKPTHKDGNPTYLWTEILQKVDEIKKIYPNIAIDYEDEALTSVDARSILFQTSSKKKRRDKKNVDKVSAVLILQKYLGHI
jgi:putative Holliday junction resolvase